MDAGMGGPHDGARLATKSCSDYRHGGSAGKWEGASAESGTGPKDVEGRPHQSTEMGSTASAALLSVRSGAEVR